MQYPDDIDQVLDSVKAFHAQIRTMAVNLPPTPAKSLINDLMDKVEPMVEQFREAQQEANAALQKQTAENTKQFEQAKRDLESVKQRLDNLPPVEEIKKNLVPVAAALPAGLSVQFAEEMLNRYAPKPIPTAGQDPQAAAWQDWSVTP